MNDDFLHRIRVEPSPEFLARLKSRLDLQPPPTTPAPAIARLRRVLLGLLLTGSVFAITLLILNRGNEEAPAITNTRPLAMPEAPRPNNSAPETHRTPVKRAEAQPTPDIKPKSPAPFTYYYITTTSLQPYLKSLNTNGRNVTILATESTTDAVSKLCMTSQDSPVPQFALVPGRLPQSELDVCNFKVSETLIGHQAVVLARSKLYGTFNLTPREIFLALAAEIPDPAHPDHLIPNPNTTWSDVNGSLEREPIEFFGPEPNSPVGVAFREILFAAGCHALGLKECPDIRKDGVYTEAAATLNDMVLKLQTKPNAIGILPFGYAFRNTSELTAGPVMGVVPTMETITNETYPGSRPLYIYFGRMAAAAGTRWGFANSMQALAAEQYAVIPLERSQP
jgi:hypothetical protein